MIWNEKGGLIQDLGRKGVRSFGEEVVEIEGIEERRVCRQVESSAALAHAETRPSPPAASALPGGGRYDHLLLGRAEALFNELGNIFKACPLVDCGRTNGRTAGLGCVYGARYAEQVFSPAAVLKHLSLAKTFWDPDPQSNFLDLDVSGDREGGFPDAQIIIVGDTHGQLEDVLWIFFKYGLPSASNQYLFNGDIVDRGGHALEILLLLFSFKRDVPESVHILRGNHEDVRCIIQYGFKVELQSKFENFLTPIWDVCTEVVFPLLPLAAHVSGTGSDFCVVHGGVPVGLPGQTQPVTLRNDLARVNRTSATVQFYEHDDFDMRMLHNLLWADPAECISDKENSRSRADKFDEGDTRQFCKANEVQFLVRSHQVPRNLRGVTTCHSGLCYTVFSASNYTGSVGNRGGVLVCSSSHEHPVTYEHRAPPWYTLSEFMSRHSRSDARTRRQAAKEWETQFGITDPDVIKAKRPPAVTKSPQGFALPGIVPVAKPPQSFALPGIVPASKPRVGLSLPGLGSRELPQSVFPPLPVERMSSEGSTVWVSEPVPKLDLSKIPQPDHRPAALYPKVSDRSDMSWREAQEYQQPKESRSDCCVFSHGSLAPSPTPAAIRFQSMAGRLVNRINAQVREAADAQLLQFMSDRIVQYKEQLFERCKAIDTSCSGTISRARLSELIVDVFDGDSDCRTVVNKYSIEDLMVSWQLPPDVKYVRFLHRFQLRDDPKEGSILVDRLRAVSLLREKLVNLSSLHLEQMLDPNGDKTVTRDEFASFLPHFNINVPPWQAAALHETLCQSCLHANQLQGHDNVTLDSAILCLALVSQDPLPENKLTAIAESVGRDIREAGSTLAGVFRSWDVNCDGFLSLAELKKGLESLPATWIKHEHIGACTEHIQSLDVDDQRVTIFEFVRALAPRRLTLSLQQAMIKEVLKRVWICRPVLLDLLAQKDPHATNKLSCLDFRECLAEVNSELERMRHQRLTDVEIWAVCEIAAAGADEVRYDQFVDGLHVEDTAEKGAGNSAAAADSCSLL